MSTKILDVALTKAILKKAIQNIEQNQEYINSLNVFPVPDGDTGTNVFTSMKDAYENIDAKEYDYAFEVFNDFAKYMLYSARGNSGVIHSQVFAGIAKGLNNIKEITTNDFSKALYTSKDTTYDSVLSPQEGTILTVIRVVSENESKYDKSSFEKLFSNIADESKLAVEKTPELLPVLKEVGVVDSGATALSLIFSGFDIELNNKEIKTFDSVSNVSDISKSGGFSTEEIKFTYCTEFLILLDTEFDRNNYIDKLKSLGDSIVAIELDGTVKSHVHTNEPNKVIEIALKFGMLNKIKIDNMHFEHNEALLNEDELSQESKIDKVDKAIIAVSNSSEMSEYLSKLGVHYIIDGGQSANPSTNDFVKAIEHLGAKEAIILPNNSNIFMSAQQTNNIVDAKVEVIKTRSIVQAYSILLVANKEANFDDLVNEMNELLSENTYSEITKSVTDTIINDIKITKNDFLGLYNKDIISSNTEFNIVLKTILDRIIDDEKEIVTIIKGKDLSKKMADELNKIITNYEELHDIEFDVLTGNQELYPVILGAD